jgi:uncharacterized RDD family membrane protein YckC
MTCSFCGSRNSAGETRCRRCGRRPEDTLLRTNGALATQPKPSDYRAEPVEGHVPNMSGAIQGSLFQVSNVIPFENYAPPRPEPRAPRTRSAAKTGKPAARRSRVPENQGRLDFLPQAPPKRRTLGTTVEAVIFCDAPVATTVHRAVAAAFDWAVVAGAYLMFLAIIRIFCGEFQLSIRINALMIFGMLPLLGITYGLIWTILGTETAGMRWMGIRLVTFLGFPLERRHRILRLVGSTLSICTVVGLLWSMADEENLTWQDHISGTFPTPLEAEERVFRRR